MRHCDDTFVICQLVCVIVSWAHTSLVHSILSLKLGVTRRAPENGGQHREPRPLGRRPRHGGPAAYGGPLLRDGVVGLPHK